MIKRQQTKLAVILVLALLSSQSFSMKFKSPEKAKRFGLLSFVKRLALGAKAEEEKALKEEPTQKAAGEELVETDEKPQENEAKTEKTKDVNECKKVKETPKNLPDSDEPEKEEVEKKENDPRVKEESEEEKSTDEAAPSTPEGQTEDIKPKEDEESTDPAVSEKSVKNEHFHYSHSKKDANPAPETETQPQTIEVIDSDKEIMKAISEEEPTPEQHRHPIVFRAGGLNELDVPESVKDRVRAVLDIINNEIPEEERDQEVIQLHLKGLYELAELVGGGQSPGDEEEEFDGSENEDAAEGLENDEDGDGDDDRQPAQNPYFEDSELEAIGWRRGGDSEEDSEDPVDREEEVG